MSENEPTRTSSLQLARPQRRGSIGSPQSTRGHAGSQEGFEVAFVDRVEGELRKPLADVAMVAFELVQPVRTFLQGAAQLPGFLLGGMLRSACRLRVLAGARRGNGVGLRRACGRVRCPAVLVVLAGHEPDPFACAGLLRANGDRRRSRDRLPGPAARIKPRDAAAFEATARACAEVGWDYRLVSEHETVWLAGYRHPRHFIARLAARLREVFERPLPLVRGASLVGDPIAVLPVVYHLLWAHHLHVDLSLRLDGAALVTTGTGS
jgi:hypothetical protein